ncbi:RNA polymerase subunit sigma [Ornithinibacillus halotolerans]|uniref:RNA polymerase subunit sigma n=1 Tax=Ornithinibacillus halotolerans TaxID=1274357 RepID=A0A916S946_9BACI|nr:RNA polymerase subunit sigma [Ornithinibacillus halotolerans]
MDGNLEMPISIHSLSRDEAIEWIMDEYGEGLKRFIYMYVKNRTQTDDLFQDILLVVYQKLDTYEGRALLKNWLYQITANKCKDYLRSPFHRLFIWKEDLLEKGTDSTPEREYLLDERKRAVIEAILELPVKYREVLILQYYMEFSIQEMSDLLKTNPSTIKTRIMRAKEKLKLLLKEDFLHE